MDFAQLGRGAIREETPAGNDVRLEESFERLQAQIDRTTDPTAGGSTDWKVVVDTGCAILETEAKDILVAAYVAVGLAKLRGAAGLADGLGLLAGMLTSHWDNLFPPVKRMRARRNALEWWLERTDEALKGLDPSPLEPELYRAMLADFQAIDDLLREKDDEAPPVYRLKASIQALPVKEPPPPPPEPEADSPRPLPDAAGGAEGSTPRAGVGFDPAAGAEGILSLLGQMSAWLLEQDRADPLGYRLQAISRWGMLQAAPHAHGGKTFFPAPESYQREALAGLLHAAAWEDLLAFTQAQLPEQPLWLDLVPAAVSALEGLGLHGAARALTAEGRLLAAQADGVAALNFSDGSPFAHAQTRQWLTPEAVSSAQGSGGAAGAADALTEVLEQAQASVNSGALVDATTLVEAHLGRNPSPRSRLVVRVRLCGWLLSQGQLHHLWAYLEPILEDIDRFGLEDWDPALALEGLSVVYQGTLALAQTQELPVTPTALVKRIARLDFARALHLDPG